MLITLYPLHPPIATLSANVVHVFVPEFTFVCKRPSIVHQAPELPVVLIKITNLFKVVYTFAADVFIIIRN